MSRLSKYIIAVLGLIVVACARDDADDSLSLHEDMILINANINDGGLWLDHASVRNNSIDLPLNDTIQSIGIFAVNNATVGDDAGLFFNNQQFFNRNASLLSQTPDLADMNWPSYNNWPYSPRRAWIGGADYTFVGYTPYSESDVSIIMADDKDFSELVWEGLSTIEPHDIMISPCVGYSASHSANPALQLNMQHLLARLRFCFKLGDNYADLRTIVIKRMKVEYPESRRMSLYAIFSHDNDSYESSYRWLREDVGTGNKTVDLHNENAVDSVILQKGKDFQPLASVYFQPGDPLSMFNIDVTYDVYDSHKNLLRKNDHAVSAVSVLRNLEAGFYYDVKIKIEPSYLYILSDLEPDSDAGLIIP